jgi:hypothetical protein
MAIMSLNVSDEQRAVLYDLANRYYAGNVSALIRDCVTTTYDRFAQADKPEARKSWRLEKIKAAGLKEV